jgi:hypothetical protein
MMKAGEYLPRTHASPVRTARLSREVDMRGLVKLDTCTA